MKKIGTPGLKMAVLLTIVMALSACGGGGGGGGGETALEPNSPPDPSGPPALTLSLTPQSIKTFHFTWADVGYQTEYRLLEDPTGSAGYTEVVALPAAATSYDHAVFLPGRVNARYILQACNNEGCNDSPAVHVTGSLADATGYVKSSNPGEYHQFGSSLALSADGRTLAVGAYGEESGAVGIDGDAFDTSAPESGAVYVYTRNGTDWHQQAYIKASNSEAGDWFGYSLWLSADGNALTVGAYGEDSAARTVNGEQADNTAVDSGAVYVYGRSGDAWGQEAYIKASNAAAEDFFGFALALSADGNTLAVGAFGEDSVGSGVGGNQDDRCLPGVCLVSTSLSGAAYVFTRSESGWRQQTYIKASNPLHGDRFGYALALSGDATTLAVGAWRQDGGAEGINGDQTDNSAIDSGAVYVFSAADDSWRQQAYVKAANAEPDDRFGYSVALSDEGDTLAVGAFYEDGGEGPIGGNPADNSALNAGAAYVFTRSGGDWRQQAYLKAANAEADDQFGCSLALSGDGSTLGVGACSESGGAFGINDLQPDNSAPGSGAAYVFTRSSGIWNSQAYVKAPNTDAKDWFGTSVALSNDGQILAVGAPGEDSNASGINGPDNNAISQCGAVYLY